MTSAQPVAELLARKTREGELYQKLPDGRVRCVACGHRCLIPPGRDGICRVRFNDQGVLRVPFGYVAALQVDPVEKKPFFHALPGATAFSFGMLGCDYHCGYCQNWITSQALRDPAALSGVRDVDPESLADAAVACGAQVVVSTYNEPLITSEWAVAVFRASRARGLACGYVSNGNATPEVLDYLRPWVDLYKVDLKSFREEAYRSLGGRLETVLDTIAGLHRRGFWTEVVTLLVPGFNDSDDELRDLTGFLASVSPEIPWHVTAFHADYRMTDPRDTSARDLFRAAEIGRRSGLFHVYAGNLPGGVGDLENTRCAECGALLVERSGYRVLRYRVADGGACPDCGHPVAGYWRDRWAPPAGDARSPVPRRVPVPPGR